MNEEHKDLIDRYFAGEMHGEELHAFLERLRADAGLRAAWKESAHNEALLWEMGQGKLLSELERGVEKAAEGDLKWVEIPTSADATTPAAAPESTFEAPARKSGRTRRSTGRPRVVRTRRIGLRATVWTLVAAAAAAVTVALLGSLPGEQGPADRKRSTALETARREKPAHGLPAHEAARETPEVARQREPARTTPTEPVGAEEKIAEAQPPAPAGDAAEPEAIALEPGRPDAAFEEPKAAAAARAPAHLAYLDILQGHVEFARAGAEAWTRAGTGVPLSPGDRLRTKLSRARIEFESGSVLFVNHWTTFTIDRAPSPPGLSMAGGEVYVTTVPHDKGFWVETAHGRAVDLGTRFGVDVGRAGTTVVVVEGKAEASTDMGKAELDAGQEVLLARRTGLPGPVREARGLERRLAWAEQLSRRTVSEDARLWLRFEGDVRDSSRFGNHGAAHGARSIAGKLGRGCGLDGTGQYVEVPHHKSLELAEGTMAAWVWVPKLPRGEKQIFNKDAGGYERGGHIRLFLRPDGLLETRLQSAVDDHAVRSRRPLRPGVWHHAAITFGKLGHRLYLDGKLEQKLTYAGGIERNSNALRIGISYSGLHPLRGVIDEVVVFGRQLTDEEMLRLFKRGGVPLEKRDPTEESRPGR